MKGGVFLNEDLMSLGMIETYGFTSLVAASDAAAKSAQVEVVTYQQAGSGIATIYVLGDVASVQASVAVGAEEAKRVGELRTSHVIPRPDKDVLTMINELKSQSKKKLNSEVDDDSMDASLDNKPISELRAMAYSSQSFPLDNSKIKTASKEDLIRELKK